MTDIKRVPLKEWRYGRANAFYTPENDTITIIEAQGLEEKTIMHEYIHAERHEKTTFKLASILNNDVYRLTLLGMLLLTSPLLLVGLYMPTLFFCVVYLLVYACSLYEEDVADTESLKRLLD